MISDCLDINSLGHLTIGGKDTVELAQAYGTPLYVMDESNIRKNCREFKQSIDLYCNGKGMVAYASKAFCCKEMCRIVADEGLGLDVVSGSELFTALSAGFPAERIMFHGNNKTPDELAYAVQSGVGRIVVDNIFELDLLNGIAESAEKTVRIHLRIKPGIDAHTHDFIKTGQIDSKFGFALETGEALAAAGQAIKYNNLELTGLDCHIGSNIYEIEPFELAAGVMLGLIAEIRDTYGHCITELDLGGGYGIRYVPENDPAPYKTYLERVSAVIQKTCEQQNIPIPFIIIEPGRSIAGPAGITLYTVGGLKEIPDIRTYLSVDGGMTDNPRYALYRSEYDMVIANRASKPKSAKYTIAGRCCESGDLLGEHIPLQEASAGDILAVLATGAYNYSMSSNYNRLPRPAVVMVRDGKARVVVRRESYEDIIRGDL